MSAWIFLLSISKALSPGPRIPTPLSFLSRLLESTLKRGKVYFNWASFTCNLPSLVFARPAKISKISIVRSITFVPIISPKLRNWLPVSGQSKITTSASNSFAMLLSSSTLPLPIYVLALISLTKKISVPTTSKNADFASNSSSFTLYSLLSIFTYGQTISAFSFTSWLIFIVILYQKFCL